ncbi:MAG: type IV secretory system conjugative DNA transfer family protein, partial [Steroidobacteraceae bacterium]
MTPDASAAAWRPPAKPSRSRRATQIVAVSLMGLLLGSYLASFVFLALIKADPRSASPLTLARYAYHYGDQAIIRQRLGLSLGAGLGVMMVSGLAVFQPHRRSLHGDARFATRREIRAAGLLGEQGIILGKLGSKCLMLAGQQGVALAAPPRAGKGTGVVIPNALNWPGSLVCIDIKRENWTITAGYRQQSGQACYLFDPFAEDGQTARWNPFSYVSRDPIRRVNDLQRIAD